MAHMLRASRRAARTTHDRDPHTVRAVPDVEAVLREAERLGGKRQMGPERAPTGLVAG